MISSSLSLTQIASLVFISLSLWISTLFLVLLDDLTEGLFLLLIFPLWFFPASTNLSVIPFFMEYSNVFILLWIFSILFDSIGLRLSFNLSFMTCLFLILLSFSNSSFWVIFPCFNKSKVLLSNLLFSRASLIRVLLRSPLSVNPNIS